MPPEQELARTVKSGNFKVKLQNYFQGRDQISTSSAPSHDFRRVQCTRGESSGELMVNTQLPIGPQLAAPGRANGLVPGATEVHFHHLSEAELVPTVAASATRAFRSYEVDLSSSELFPVRRQGADSRTTTPGASAAFWRRTGKW